MSLRIQSRRDSNNFLSLICNHYSQCWFTSINYLVKKAKDYLPKKITESYSVRTIMVIIDACKTV
jgi:hypothetical protein